MYSSRERSITGPEEASDGLWPAAVNHNMGFVCPSVLQRERNVVSVFDEGDNVSIALCIGGSPASYGLSTSLIGTISL